MSYEILLGMQILDNEQYNQYRAGMKPILASYDGKFGYDFKVSEVLIYEQNPEMNRVFTLNFKTRQQKSDFFKDPAYIAVNKQFFVGAVDKVTLIAAYEKAD